MKYITIRNQTLAENILATLVPDEPVFADIETEVLYDKVRLIQLYQPSTIDLVYIIDIDYVDLDTVKDMIRPLHTIWYGANYDFGTLNMTTAKYDDIQLLMRTAYPSLPKFDLATVTKHLILENIYDGLDKKALQKSGFKLGSVLSEEQLRYSATDVYALAILWKLPKIQETTKIFFYKVDMLLLDYTVQFQQNGAIVDTAGVRRELDKMPEIIEEEEKILQGINSKSPKQIKKAFETLLGYPPEKTDKTFLINTITEHEGTAVALFAKAVFDNRRSRLRVTNLEKLNRNNVITRFNPYGTVTGRYSSTGKDFDNGINFQNVTRDLQYLLAQDTEDTVVVHADFSTAELRAGCSIMGDQQMRKYLLDGVDLHKVSAQLADKSITNLEDVTKEQRQKGKAVSFGLIFGMSWARFKEYAYTDYGVVFTDEEAKAVKKEYQLKYPDVTNYHKYWWNNYKTEYVESPMGRKNRPRLGTDAINFATQSAIGETCKLAIHYLITDNKDKPVLKYLYSQVHDAIYLRVPKELGDEYGYLLAKAMMKAWTEILKLPMFKFKDIPIGVEFEVGANSIPVEVFSIEELDKWKQN